MKDLFARQFSNLFLWSPFIMAFGAALYFSINFEPDIAYPILISVLCACILIFRRTSIITTGMLLFAFGLFYACAYTKTINTPQMTRDLRNINITGIVANIDHTNDKSRVFIKIPANQINPNLSENKTAAVRLSFGTDHELPNIGDAINATVTLFKPGGPDAPGAFDYARWAYFNGISATGYINNYNAPPVSNSQAGNINSLRDFIHNKTNSFLSDALVLGYKNAVPKDDGPIWTATGIGHVWSISGFHMTLVGGWLFILFYFISRSIPAITRRIPARYPAMIFAWIGLLFYLFLSGIDVATVRAFLMTTLVFAAFIFGRNGFSLRNICIVFGLIFLLNPHYVMQPGFQLSFSAIFGLVWYFNRKKYQKTSLFKKIIRVINAAAMTSVIATIFTSVFVIYHFNAIPIYGLIGNLILLPLFSFAIMPLVIIGTITALFGMTFLLSWSDGIYNFALKFAHMISELPFASLNAPAIPGIALFIMIVGFMCLMFIKNTDKGILKRANLLFFAILISAGIVLTITNQRPLFYATDDHDLVGFVIDGKLQFNKSSASGHYFTFDTWKQLNFEPIGTPNKRQKCIKGVCTHETKNWNLKYIPRYMPLSRNIVNFCDDPKIDFIVSYFNVTSPSCDHKILKNGFVIYESGKVKYTPSARWWQKQPKD